MARKDTNRATKAQAAERRRVALEYRKAGMSYRAIAEKLGVSHNQAFKDVQAVLTEIKAQARESADELVQIENERLDNAQLSIAHRVAKGELGAIDRWIRISESRRKLLGLDAPMKIAPTTPDGEKPYDEQPSLDERIARVAALLERGRTRRDRAGNRGD